MESFAKLISALASLAWPILFLFLIIRFYEPIRKLLESVNGRKFSIKVAGNELTFEEASEQQGNIIADLQTKLAVLESDGTVQPFTTQESERIEQASKNILWVDDSPKNNSYLVAFIESQGHNVDIALTTSEGLRKAGEKNYDAIISDMARPESDKAGIDLAQKIRLSNPTIPFFVYCGKWASSNLKDESSAAGISGITSSSSTLMQYLARAFRSSS